MPGETDEGKAPEGIICQLSKRVARDPVRTPYGHVSTRVRGELPTADYREVILSGNLERAFRCP